MYIPRLSRRSTAIAAGVICAAVALPSAAIAVTSANAGTVSAELQQTSTGTWYGGGQFVVQNGTGSVSDWKLAFTVPNGTFTNHSSSATNTEVHGDHVVITPKSPLAAGQSAYISFGIAGDGSAELAPEACDIDGADVAGCTPGDGGGNPEPGEDTEKPSTVTNLTTEFSHEDRVHVMWAHASDNVGVDQYELERNGKHLMFVEGSKRMLDVAGHEAGATYEYRVRAVDEAGNEGEWSSISSVTMPAAPGEDTEVPSKPGDLKFSEVTARTATVRWAPSIDNVGVTGYTAFIEQGGKVVEHETSGTSVTFTGLDPNTKYMVGVTAHDAAGNQSVGAAGNVTTDDEETVEPGTGTPAGFTATADSYQDGTTTMHRIKMTWTPTDGAFTRYEIILDGKRAQTLHVGDQESAAIQQGKQTRFLALGPDSPAAGHTVQVRAQLADGSWSAPTAPITVR